MGKALAAVSLAAALLSAACTIHHTKIPLADSHETAPSNDAVFVTEDDSGLALLGIFVLTEPDHYAILVERARRRYRCASLHHIQFDFYTDFWVFVGFPIARITAVCERVKAELRTPGSGAAPAAAAARGARRAPAPETRD